MFCFCLVQSSTLSHPTFCETYPHHEFTTTVNASGLTSSTIIYITNTGWWIQGTSRNPKRTEEARQKTLPPPSFSTPLPTTQRVTTDTRYDITGKQSIQAVEWKTWELPIRSERESAAESGCHRRWDDGSVCV